MPQNHLLLISDNTYILFYMSKNSSKSKYHC